MANNDIFAGVTAPGLAAPLKPSSKNPMERIAEEVAYGEKMEELHHGVYLVLAEVAEGLYKHVRVNMRGVDGNAFVILGVVINALTKAGAPLFHRKVFKSWATANDYDHLLRTCAEWVTIVDEPEEDHSAITAFQKFQKEI